MRKENIKKLLPTVSIFAFVAFAFVIAYAFGDTYAATYVCPNGYEELSDGICCPNGGVRYDSSTNQCLASYNNGCPGIYTEGYSNSGTCTAVPRSKNAFYTVRLDLDGGSVSSGTLTSQSILSGGTYVLPTPTRAGYTFTGWQYSYNGLNYTKSAGERVEITHDITYTATWEALLYTVTFNPDGGTVSPSQKTVASGDKITLPTPTKNGHTFTGWQYSYNGLNYTKSAGEEVEITHDITYTATWKALCTVTFNPNGGTVSLTQKTVASGEKVTLPTPSRDGHTFTGWQYSYNGLNYTKSAGEEVEITHPITYIAQWEENSTNPDSGNSGTGGGSSTGGGNTSGDSGTTGGGSTGDNGTDNDTTNNTKYTVKFNLDNGSLYVNDKETSTTSYSLSELDYSLYTAKKSGYTFTGWSTKANSCNTVITKGKKDLTSDIELYACYKSNDKVSNETGKVTSKEEINNNPKTGSTLLYIVYLVGILALGYTVYYSYKVVKSKR